MNFKIKAAVLEKDADKYSFARRAVERLQSSCPVRVDEALPVQRSDDFDLDKGTLRLLSFPGQLLKPCPGTREYLCCGYQILNIGTNCPLDCSYCILQAYFNQPCLRVFVFCHKRRQDFCPLHDRVKSQAVRELSCPDSENRPL